MRVQRPDTRRPVNVAAGRNSGVVIGFGACKSAVTRGGKDSYALEPAVEMLPAAGHAAKAVDGVGIATANQAGVDFTLAP